MSTRDRHSCLTFVSDRQPPNVVDNAVNPRMTSLWSAAAHRCGAVPPRHAPAAAGPLRIQRHPSRRLPHRLTTRPTHDDARSPPLDLKHISAVALTIATRFTYPQRFPTIHVLHTWCTLGRYPGRVTAEAGEIAFPRCDHEPAQAHRLVRL